MKHIRKTYFKLYYGVRIAIPICPIVGVINVEVHTVGTASIGTTRRVGHCGNFGVAPHKSRLEDYTSKIAFSTIFVNLIP